MINIIIIAGTNNLFDKENLLVMILVETSDELSYLARKLLFDSLYVGIMELIPRKEQEKMTNRCFRNVVRELDIQAVKAV